jgi:hypothetical protein
MGAGEDEAKEMILLEQHHLEIGYRAEQLYEPTRAAGWRKEAG